MGSSCSAENWRTPEIGFDWTKKIKTDLIDDINAIETRESVTPCILIAGPISSGKSSLVNTFLSCGAGRIARKAEAGTDERSLTTKFIRYTGSNSRITREYRVCDTMGILDSLERGIRPNDMASVLDGHIGPGYSFKDDADISDSDEHYVKHPEEGAKSHCLIVVVSCSQIAEITSNYSSKIKKSFRVARDKGIPVVIILTKADKLCEEVEHDATKIFRCLHVRHVVKMTSEKLGVPEGYIFPVINYSSQVIASLQLELIALVALKKVLEFTQDHIEGPEK